ncbi:tRNA pseudouridine(55) synthase TruB [Sporosarcina pasteurii]|uniref:tRNA pseudouridine synthase B n=1 Tax=Sporosarcina pasteurii TaxID=1474 RepID=A0A380BJ95_SPOPA|nr:tRNA pseudouridine(55) synthase TruB [Sporosarcina pasteurii]MDS9470626.1 tRNA pseudouridine(55) synthase TruB [Sporosarcina pasteurii]QBQ05687.1 tRNA pseudouridine(55) synthase TruB [Sporosarcina pasteurii]SUJ01330.1 tRNA pseudouridine synthase B [Sporosarcina pasteurii]
MKGILPLWKEKGMTSHDCVFKLRKILGTKKVGHTGTLDPNVEGVLPICIGQATRIAEYITDSGKEYVAVISIGTSTETEDADGAIVEQDTSIKEINRQEIEEALHKLTGEITQIPPMYSAVKVKGKRLYEYARKGIVVERPERKVLIEQLELLSKETEFEGPEITFTIRIKCGKGTYIRTLAVQIGELLGYPAHMASLIRTASGNFRREDCFTLDEVAHAKEESRIDEQIRPIEEALSEFHFIEVDNEMYGKIVNGQVLPIHSKLQTESKIVFTKNHKALAVYIQHPTKEYLMKPEKMFPL